MRRGDWRANNERSRDSIEPGIYLPAFGVRSEVDVYVAGDDVLVTGGPQRAMTALLG
jgi:hypothetical protein